MTKNTGIHFGLINARSVKNKTTAISNYITDNDLDIIAVTETWLGSDGRDCVVEGNMCPSGFKLVHVPRSHMRGGGVALIYKENLNIVQTPCKTYVSFELIEVKISPSHGKCFTISVIYRPPPSLKNGLNFQLFLKEFGDFVDDRILQQEKLFICGDFNIHMDDIKNKDADCFNSVLTSYGLEQHVKEPTHSKGHTLDLLITRGSDTLIQEITVKNMLISDHFWVHCSMSCSRPGVVRKRLSYRNIKKIDLDSFRRDIANSPLSKPDEFDDVGKLVSTYNKVLSDILDKHAPLNERVFTIRPDAPWFTSEIAEAKRACRKAERKFRRTKLTIHKQLFQEAQEHLHSLIDHAKQEHFSSKVESSDQKSLFKVVNTLMNKSKSTKLPSYDSPKELADRFCDFFSEKICKIREDLSYIKSDMTGTSCTAPNVTTSSFSCFEPASEEEVRKLIMSNKSKSCAQDPIPTSLLKECLSSLLPIITKLVNLSMSQGIVPSELKKALILPLLKKSGLDIEILKHFRPVSNLTYISKLVERLVATRFIDYIAANNLQELFQSSYTKFHSTETALIRVQNDILTAIDGRKCVLLVLLDLSAAFDTVDHSILLSRLASRYGVKDIALKWFKSYLSDRVQAVLIDGKESKLHHLLCGVPQGSVLGPILFILYTSPLADLLKECGISYHFYADDTQLYISFDLHEHQDVISKMEQCIEKVRTWMADNFLKLNDEKTEVLFFGSKNLIANLDASPMTIGSEQIAPTDVAKNIGAYMDKYLNMDTQVSQVCKGAWLHLRNIGKIRPYLTESCTEKLIHAFVSSKLDSNNGLLYGTPKDKLDRLQRVQNAAARLVTRTRKYDHITPVLQSLHWLPVHQRIHYKILLLTFKSLAGKAPSYLQELLEVSTQSRSLRSNDQRLLVCPKSKCVKYGDRSFRVAGPTLWNKLPLKIRLSESVEEFKSQLKTHLFKCAYY